MASEIECSHRQSLCHSPSSSIHFHGEKLFIVKRTHVSNLITKTLKDIEGSKCVIMISLKNKKEFWVRE